LLADHDRTGRRLEPSNQADLLEISTRLVPGKPEVIRSADFCFGLVLAQYFGGKHKLLVRRGVPFAAAFFVESIDNHRPVDVDRLVLFTAIEEHSPAEPADRRFVGFVEHRIIPDRDQFVGRLFVF